MHSYIYKIEVKDIKNLDSTEKKLADNAMENPVGEVAVGGFECNILRGNVQYVRGHFFLSRENVLEVFPTAQDLLEKSEKNAIGHYPPFSFQRTSCENLSFGFCEKNGKECLHEKTISSASWSSANAEQMEDALKNGYPK